MTKLQILKLIGKTALGAGAMIDPRIGLAVKGVQSLIKRDDDPTNDLEETADAITEIVLNTIGTVEDLTGKDVIDNAIMAQLAANIKGDIVLYLQLVKALKPVLTPPAG